MNEDQEFYEKNRGAVVSIKGNVIDAQSRENLPEIHNKLKAGDDGRVVIEVFTHLNSEVVYTFGHLSACIVLSHKMSSQGLYPSIFNLYHHER
jgi:F0F1-type ATP synthase beta subunit